VKDTTRKEALDFFAGGGELGALMRAYDWTTTPLGVPGRWPQSLRTAWSAPLRADRVRLLV
jgi:hypothetical protein